MNSTLINDKNCHLSSLNFERESFLFFNLLKLLYILQIIVVIFMLLKHGFFLVFSFYCFLFSAEFGERKEYLKGSTAGGNSFYTVIEMSPSLWHEDCAKRIKNARDEAMHLDPGKRTNFAMFCITAIGSDNKKIFVDFSRIIFASGGDLEFLGNLMPRLAPFEITEVQSPAHYWPFNPERPADAALREGISSFFEFKESISSEGKEGIVSAFTSQIRRDGYFENRGYFGVTLLDDARRKLADSCRASLDFRVFTEESNTKAHTLGLMDKTKKTTENWHLNDLFGSAFQLNFADSEQAIRAFIYKGDYLKGNLDTAEGFLNFGESVGLRATQYKTAFDTLSELTRKELRQKKINEPGDLKDISDILDAEIIQVIEQSNIRFTLNIASYYEMCKNCQATFQYDLTDRKHIQKYCLLILIKKEKNLTPDLRWYINGRLHQYELANKLPSMVDLLISHQIKYNSEGGNHVH